MVGIIRLFPSGPVRPHIVRHCAESQRIDIGALLAQVAVKVSKVSEPVTAKFILVTGAAQPFALANCSALDWNLDLIGAGL